MAEPEQPPQLPEAPFPAPPPFWKHFTLANEEKLKQIDQSGNSDAKLPLPLAYLRPPPPPAASAETYTTFGQDQVIDPSQLSSLPLDQLLFDPNDPHLDHAFLLRKLNKSILLNFLELTSTLALDPSQHADKMDDIRRLFLNVHVVINMYRPHQSRESTKDLLQEILEDGQREIDECEAMKGRIQTFLDQVATLPSADVATSDSTRTDTVKPLGDKEDKITLQQKLWEDIKNI
ncbi:hypothetical protein PV10_07653 [Exophiala mesophila]|uniref:Mediator of RNA polymerase II transcription subunit 7 n=1 Tax=Exophiala mesophila TaxID=212818 RepID=A0A0D1XQG1_EXOME|nr:uncharacterized protein PV10_07653 [Exophiala mesophila]KIV90341.1 hypothetical protein PV10_07653 [Exophiala mesophila]